MSSKNRPRIFLFIDVLSDNTRGIAISIAESKEDAIDNLMKEYDETAMIEQAKLKLIDQWTTLNRPIHKELDEIYKPSRIRTMNDVAVNKVCMGEGVVERTTNLVKKLEELEENHIQVLDDLMSKTNSYLGTKKMSRKDLESSLHRAQVKEITDYKNFALFNGGARSN